MKKAIIVVMLSVVSALAQDVPAKQVKPGKFQNGTYEFPGNVKASSVAVGATVQGLKPTGTSDDTAMLQNALNNYNELLLQPGTYLIDAATTGDDGRNGRAGGIAPRSNTRIRCAPGAVLKAITNNATDYNVIRLTEVDNVTIEGCTIQGDRATHTGLTGEWGHGIGIYGATNVTLRDVVTKDCWGDGIMLASKRTTVKGQQAAHIRGYNVLSTNNRRQGMSVVDASDVYFESSTFSYTNGIAPEAGIDIEPGGWENAVSNFECKACQFQHNNGRGFVAQTDTTGDIDGVRLKGGDSSFNLSEGVSFVAGVKSAQADGMNVHDNGGHGLYAINAVDGGVKFSNNIVSANSTSLNNGYDNIYVQTSDGVEVSGNTVRVGANTNKPVYGVGLNTSTNVVVSANDLRGSGATTGAPGDLNEYSTTGTVGKPTNFRTGNALSALTGNALNLTPDAPFSAYTGGFAFNGSGWVLDSGTAIMVLKAATNIYVNISGTDSWMIGDNVIRPVADNGGEIGQDGAAVAKVTSYAAHLLKGINGGAVGLTIVPGTKAGTGATASCASGAVCDNISGTIALAAGTGVDTTQYNAAIVTVTFPVARANAPNCLIQVENDSQGQMVTAFKPVTTTTTLAFTSFHTAALISSNNYKLFYVCGGI